VRLHEWLRVWGRYWLAADVISYGAFKAIPSQFPVPPLDRLLQPFGTTRPLAFLWTFMGASPPYNVFTGLAEMTGGLLLVFRRTTTLGALVCMGVVGNIVMLNFGYDVPVKLRCTHLFVVAVFLLLPDLRRLIDALVLNRRAAPARIEPHFRSKWLQRGALVLKMAFILLLTNQMLNWSWQGLKVYGASAPEPPLYGIWEVSEMVVDGQVRPPLVTDRDRWRWVVFDHPDRLAALTMAGARLRYWLELDTATRSMNLRLTSRENVTGSFSYREVGPGLLAMEGTLEGRKVQARLRRTEIPKFLLVHRGFHWVNERPLNR
jgi:hypothetical protein